jgi:hypothetical protein
LFAAPPVAQEPVELFQRGLVVASVALVGDGDVFVGMDVMHRDCSRVALGDRVLQSSRAKEQKKNSKTAQIAGARRNESTNSQARLTNGHWRSRDDALSNHPLRPVAAASNANTVLIWEGLTRPTATPPPTGIGLTSQCGEKWP